jgi:hypothetical protein
MVVGVVKSASKDSGGDSVTKISMRTKLSWLFAMLAGGAILLALEHIWHGEVIFAPPFLTAMQSAEATETMLTEIATVGVGMVAMVTAAWGLLVLAVTRIPVLRRAVVKAK